MTFITLDEAKAYLRIDTADEDAVIGSLLNAAGRLCCDVARLTPEQWADIDSDKSRSERYTCAELAALREIIRVAALSFSAPLLSRLTPSTAEARPSAISLSIA